MKLVWTSILKSIQPQAPLVWSLVIVGTMGIVFSLTHVMFLAYVQDDDGVQALNKRVDPVTVSAIDTVAPVKDDEATSRTSSDVTSDQTFLVTETKERVVMNSKEASGTPVRLTIPKISVNATVVHVGMTSDGAMETPKGPSDVAWFDLGPLPGEEGSAVISGHYGWKGNIHAVFDDLHTLQKGDKLSVEDGQGITTMFVVREVLTYDEHQDATAIFASSDGKAHLNLITCGGVWNEDQKSYSERLVVFTDEV